MLQAHPVLPSFRAKVRFVRGEPLSRINSIWPALLVGLSVGVAGCTSTPEVAEETPAPSAQLQVCHGYDCHFKTKVTFSARDARVVAGYFRGARTPAAERAAISRAVQYFENMATKTIGVADRGMSAFLGAKERGQMDCLDEAANTNTLLRYLAGRRLLKHHKVGQNVSRGFLLDARYFHAAASITDSAGTRWAVDSWYGAAGQPPQIMPLSEWRTSGTLGELWQAE